MLFLIWADEKYNTQKHPSVVFATQKNPGVFHRPKKIPIGQNVRPKKILRTPPSLKYVSGAPGLPCWWRWTMSGRYSQSGISMLRSGSCNDGDPRAKLTKRSKQPIYTRLNVGQFYEKITSKCDFQNKTRLHQLSIAISVNTMASLFRLICCLFVFYWFQVINDFIEDVCLFYSSERWYEAGWTWKFEN